MTPYETFKTAQAMLEETYYAAARALGNVPGVGTGKMGLTPDAVRATSEYKNAKAAMDAAFHALRKFNGSYINQFATERRAERDERLKKGRP